MQNAAFAALGLDWAYVVLPTPPQRLEDAVRGLAALGFAGANVTTPHKQAVTAFCETDVPSVNTLAVREGRIEGSSTDTAILDGLARAERRRALGAAGRRYVETHHHWDTCLKPLVDAVLPSVAS